MLVQPTVPESLGVPKKLLGSLQGQNYLHGKTKAFLPFHCVDICSNGANAILGKTVNTSAKSRQ